MKYSLIIPVHNSADTLRATLQSVEHQIRQFDEIILVENGSTDASLSVAQEFTEQRPVAQVIISEKAGSAFARNLGIKAATGDYLFFLDADDTIHELLLFELDHVVQEQIAGKQAADLYEINFNHYFSKKTYARNPFILPAGTYKGDAYLEETLTSFHEESKFMAWRFLYKREFFTIGQRFFPEDMSLFEDIAFMLQYLREDVTIYVTGKTPLLNYLFQEHSLTQTTDAHFLEALEQVYQKLETPSALQKQYFLELAAKILSAESFMLFAQEMEGYPATEARLAYQKIKMARFFRRLRRKWDKVSDSEI